MSTFPVRRNTLVLGATLLILAIFAWAGWANWEYRRQQAERTLAHTGQGELVPAPSSGSSPASSAGEPAYVSPLNGKPAPAFALSDLSGKKVSLANYKGKAVMLNFWATWCAPCRIETPWIVELRQKYAAQGFEVLGIDTEGDDLEKNDKAGWAKATAAANKFVTQEEIPYPVLLDGDSLSRAYGGLDDLPTSFFVDRKGVVVAAQVGLTSEQDIESKIQKSLSN
jgi:thiol-disulfide isomerase/thioredoxin